MKYCWDCKKTKSLDDFYNNIRSKDGKQDRCKRCCKDYAAANYLRNKPQILTSNKKWMNENPEKMAAARKDWQERNHDKLLAYDRRWKNTHRALMRQRDRDRYDPVKASAKNAKYRTEHPEEFAAAKKRWNQEHPEKVAVHNATGRARRKQALISDFASDEWMFLQDLYGHCCAYCGVKAIPLAKDHIIALAAGGNHTLTNILPCCTSCNSRKNDDKFIIPLLLRCADGVERPPEAFIPQWRTPIPVAAPLIPSASSATTQLSLL